MYYLEMCTCIENSGQAVEPTLLRKRLDPNVSKTPEFDPDSNLCFHKR